MRIVTQLTTGGPEVLEVGRAPVPEPLPIKTLSPTLGAEITATPQVDVPIESNAASAPTAMCTYGGAGLMITWRNVTARAHAPGLASRSNASAAAGLPSARSARASA